MAKNLSKIKKEDYLFLLICKVTKFGDLFGCLGFLNAIIVVKRRKNYAKYVG